MAKAELINSKVARKRSLPDTPTKSAKSAKLDPLEIKLKPRKLTFSDEVSVHQYDIETEGSSSSLCSEDIDRDMTNDSADDILCPESPENSDSLFNTDTESETDSSEIMGGKRAKKAFKVKFGQIP